MIIREYSPKDFEQILSLFHETVHAINSRDYDEDQIEAWAPTTANIRQWESRLQENYSIVAVQDEMVLGFATLVDQQNIDATYVHKDHQQCGIGKALIQRLQEMALELKTTVLRTEASSTATPFFERLGFQVTIERKKIHNGQTFNTYGMQKML